MGDMAGSPRALALAARLRQARADAGLSVRALGIKANIPFSQISKWETGSAIPSIDQVTAVVYAAGVSPEDMREILAIARRVHEPDWLTVGVTGLPTQLTGVMECENAAVHIVEWSPFAVPGLLQTNDYIRTARSVSGWTGSELGIRVMVQGGRQDVVKRRANPVLFDAFIGEAVLFEQTGSQEMRRDQLHYLLEMSNRSNITIQLVPLRREWHPGFAGPFVLYSFPDASPVVYFEHHSSGAFVNDEHDIAEYEKAVDWLHRIALSPDETSAAIISAAEGMEDTDERDALA